MTLLLAVISCVVAGYFLVALGWPLRYRSVYEWLLGASLSVGFGIGVFSVIFFLALVAGLTHLLVLDLGLVALLAGCLWFWRTRLSSVHARAAAGMRSPLPQWLDRVVMACLGLALAAAFYAAILRSIVHPHGEGWDAFAIWNLHARFLFRGGAHWRDGFSSLIPWSHPDYPLLLPSAVAHFWTVLGHESTAVPAIIGLAFTFCTVGLLCGSLGVLRGRICALLGGLALLSTPLFVEQGASQYADVPLSFFFLAVIALIQLADGRGALFLSGLAAGFAVWTKNEGMLFLCALMAAHVIETIRRRTVQPKIYNTAQLMAFGIPVAVFVALVVWLKHSIAFPNEIFSDPQTMLQKALSPNRYWAIIQWFAKDFLRFGEWWPIPSTLLLPALYFLTAGERSKPASPAFRASVLTLFLTLAGYFAIYVITPYDLYWHLRFSLNRLFLQLWPSTIFLFFLALPHWRPEKVSK